MTNSIKDLFNKILAGKKPENLYRPIEYILMQSGKRLRPQLVSYASRMFGGDEDGALHIAAAFEMLHNFTLIHDDIMDKADVRRGEPTVYRKWNTNIAILSGDALAVMAMQQLHKLRCDPQTIIEISEVFTQTALEICEGQQYDLDFETRDNVSIDDYVEMVRLKTAVMFAGCLKTGGMFAGADTESLAALYDLGIHLGIAFQLADDLLDVYADTEVFGKAVGGDIKDNKKTFVFLKALELSDSGQNKTLKALYSDKEMEENEKFMKVKAIYDSVGVRKASEEAIMNYSKLCYEDLKRINAGDEKKKELVDLVKKLQNREK